MSGPPRKYDLDPRARAPRARAWRRLSGTPSGCCKGRRRSTSPTQAFDGGGSKHLAAATRAAPKRPQQRGNHELRCCKQR
eukprot:8757421-Alexandrium_andersonii.AAC.1